MSNESVNPMGKCDISGCNNDATRWYGSTSAKLCSSRECDDAISVRYADHCKAMEEQDQLEQEMIEQWGDPDNY